MEQSIVYSSNGSNQSTEQVKTFDSLIESYLNLLSDEKVLEMKIEKIKRNIRDTESAINYELRGNAHVGRMVKVNDRIFCCLKGEDSPIMIEMQE